MILALVIYDISDNKQRTKLAEHLKEYGLHRIQYSGFVGELNPHDRLILIKEVRKYITPLEKKISEKEKESGEPLSEDELANLKPDSIYVIPLCDRDENLCKIVAEHELGLKDAKEVTIVEYNQLELTLIQAQKWK